MRCAIASTAGGWRSLGTTCCLVRTAPLCLYCLCSIRGYVRDTCNFSPQQVLSRKSKFLGQPIGATFGVENQQIVRVVLPNPFGHVISSLRIMVGIGAIYRNCNVLFLLCLQLVTTFCMYPEHTPSKRARASKRASKGARAWQEWTNTRCVPGRQGWHHHMALSLMAVWFLIGETHRGQQATPALTLPQCAMG